MNKNTVTADLPAAFRSVRYIFIVLLFSAAALPADALTLAEAQTRAEAENPGLRALGERYEAATERIPQSRALPDPRLQVTYFGESIQTRTGPQEAAYAFTQMIPLPAKLWRREDMAGSEAEAVGFSYRSAALDLRRDVALAYYETAYLEKAVDTTRMNLELLKDLQAIVEERVRGGGELNQLLRLNVELERNDDKLANLSQQQATLRARFAALIGTDITGEFEVAEELVPPEESPGIRVLDPVALELEMLANNPGLRSMRQGIESAQFRAELAKLERYPDITLGLNYIDLGTPVMASTPDAGKDPWGVSVAINLPIWEGRNRAAIREARAMQRSAESMYRDRVLQMKAMLSSAVARRNESAARVIRYRDSLLPLAGQALENTRSGYESGRLSILDLIDSERSILELKLGFWRAVADLKQADATIEALTGTQTTYGNEN